MDRAVETRPRQAVVLAGGRGTRLRPLTDARPKPMIEFHGRPFLDYIVEMLAAQGLERVVMLLGYLPQAVQEHFGDGRRWGVEITYSISDADDLTARRLQFAEDLLDECFLLLYCDNYWPLRMDHMWDRYRELNRPAMVTVYANSDGYSRNNVRVGVDGAVVAFDRTRTMPGLRGVEISYAILTKPVLEHLPRGGDALFEDAVYPALIARSRLSAYVTEHRYYSVGSLERLPLTNTFLARRRTVILDRDGVLNVRPARAEYVRTPDEFVWLPGALQALRLLSGSGTRIIVVSNQAGIARGAMTAEDLARVHDKLRREASDAGAIIEAIYHCPHGWGEMCDCRKPRPGMLFQAQRDFHLDLTRTPFIGDDERDAEAAAAAGCPSLLVSDHVSLLDLVRRITPTAAVVSA